MAGGCYRRTQVHGGVSAASCVVPVQAAVHQERNEPVRSNGHRAVLHYPRRSADEGKLREREAQRLIHLRSRSTRLPHLQTLQTFTGMHWRRQLWGTGARAPPPSTSS